MSRTVRFLAAAAAALAAGCAAQAAPVQGSVEQGPFATRELKLPKMAAALPYTIDVPQGWEVRPWLNDQWLLIAPPGELPGEVGKPANPRAMIVRHSLVDIRDVATVVANIKANAAEDKQAKWDAVEVREVAGVQGIFSQIEGGEGEAERVTYGLKVPYGSQSIDFTISCPKGAFSEYRPLYERMFQSIKKKAS